MPISLSDQKRRDASAIADAFRPGQFVCLTTHVNPDGDGLGSEAALAHLLMDRGIDVAVTNPTATPPRLDFVFSDLPGIDKTEMAVKQIRKADLVVVLDISDLGRLGMLADEVSGRGVPVVCIDHHISEGTLPPGPRYVDYTAAATGELIFEIAMANDWRVDLATARALYVALMTDTGGFRFSNTHPRTLRIAADLLERGVNPEAIYADVYASAPPGRPRLVGEALQTLVHEPDVGLAWITIPPGALERYQLTADDLAGVVEYPRSIAGVRLALMFREIAGGRVKVSLRSMGSVDVSEFARKFDGGGHRRAAGLSVKGTMAEVQRQVLAAARELLAAPAGRDGPSD